MPQSEDQRKLALESNVAILKNLPPEKLWEWFGKILAIPHGSGNEFRLATFILAEAKNRGLESIIDEAGNVIIYVPATFGCQNAPIAVLQAHLDMVCKKLDEIDFDFEHDVIKLMRAGDWLKADGTTLGADNGIGLAAILTAIFCQEVVHGPLEVVLTVQEETTMGGIKALNRELLKGRIYINLDSENIDNVYFGCAGGIGVDTALVTERIAIPTEYLAARLSVSGLRGGHSGVNIHEGRANAIKALADVLDQVDWAVNGGIRLVDLQAGAEHNVIPQTASAVVAFLDGHNQEKVISAVDSAQKTLRRQFPQEPGLTVEVTLWPKSELMVTSDDTRKMINLMLAHPDGVLGMDPNVPDLVESSSTLTNANIIEGVLMLHDSPRSASAEDLDRVVKQITAINNLVGAGTRTSNAYPGWKPNPNSPIVNLFVHLYPGLFNQQPKRKAIHAGLETGDVSEKSPDMDIVSFGPTIENPHSPEERVHLQTVDQFWRLFLCLLEAIGKGGYAEFTGK